MMNHQIKVLMVDDEDRFRQTIKNIFEVRGFETILAGSGPEALEKLSEQPDVVILDIKMPGMDGHETLKRIKTEAPDMPVIMLTGHGALASAQQALSEGAFDYLTKPCDIALLSSKIRDAYQHSQKQAPPEEKKVGEVMVPISEYTVLNAHQTIRDGINALKNSFAAKLNTSRLMETGHRSVLLTSPTDGLVGTLCIRDLLAALMPPYLSAAKPATADGLQYSPMFWDGMFTTQIKEIAERKISEVMSPPPQSISSSANLIEAAYLMLEKNERRIAVIADEELVGVLREQDLFFEMERIIRH